MNYFNNIDINFDKDKLVEGILKDVYNIVQHYKKFFLNDQLYFHYILSLNTQINFTDGEKNICEVIQFKPLTIEDFLYHNLEEVLFNFKIYLLACLNDMIDIYHLHFSKVSIAYKTGVVFV